MLLKKIFLHRIIALIERIIPIQKVYAHCDVPCGLYSPNAALMAADTVVKMVEKIEALGTEQSLANQNSFIRMVAVKEEHAQLCKKELLILWTDYFKQEHLARFPDLHEKFWKTAKLCSRNKQEVSIETAKELKAAVGEIAEIFYKAEVAKNKK